jgi:hypothetical protein
MRQRALVRFGPDQLSITSDVRMAANQAAVVLGPMALTRSQYLGELAMSVKPTQASSDRREERATPDGSTASRSYGAKIEIPANDHPIVFPKVAVAFYDLQQIGCHVLV